MSSNGVGPWWFHPKLRKWVTDFSRHFFSEASWQKHDEGYKRGDPSRAICDLKFLQAMKRDALMQKGFMRLSCYALAYSYYGLCRLLGWTAYNG